MMNTYDLYIPRRCPCGGPDCAGNDIVKLRYLLPDDTTDEFLIRVATGALEYLQPLLVKQGLYLTTARVEQIIDVETRESRFVCECSAQDLETAMVMAAAVRDKLVAERNGGRLAS